jgi:OOP family OmpA-OmpF porin
VAYAADTFFDFDKSVIKPEGRAKLDDLVAKTQGIAREVIIAVGYTDSVGTDAYNKGLSDRRAASVKNYLVSKGVPANRIYTEGKGEKDPIASNSTSEGRAKNRRVEIEVVGTRPAP